jgi:hypothetical protein
MPLQNPTVYGAVGANMRVRPGLTLLRQKFNLVLTLTYHRTKTWQVKPKPARSKIRKLERLEYLLTFSRF